MYLSAILYSHSFPSHPLLSPSPLLLPPPPPPPPPLVHLLPTPQTTRTPDYQNPKLPEPQTTRTPDYQNPRLPEPHAPSIVELLWCYSSCRTIPWERRRSSIRVTRRSSWQFVMRASAEDNHSKPGAVCPQVSWWGGGWGDSDTRVYWSCCVMLSPMFYYAWPFQLL